AAISEPSQGTVLYAEESLNIQWRAVDDSRIARVSIKANGNSVYSRNDFSLRSESGSLLYTIPTNTDELTLEITATDIYNNSATSNWHYTIDDDQPPAISIRHPAAGSRYFEGEAFTVNALVTDDRQVKEVIFFTRMNEQENIVKRYQGAEINQVINQNEYFSALMRAPN